MEADNQNKWNSIRTNLDQLSEIPGEPAFNTNAAWSKLSERLVKKPVHRKPAFYWPAAATLLLLLTAGWFHFQKSSELPLVKTPSINKSSNKEIPLKATAIKENAQKVQESIVPRDNLVTRDVKRRRAISKEVKKVATTDGSSSLVVINEPEQIPEEATVTSLPVPDTLALVKLKPVRKLKVIHNNQLNSLLFKPELSISNAPPLHPQAPGNLRFSRNASDNIVQIKLSLTN